jgi:ABC-type uncharacterized transport system substrate-binding protein
MKDSKIIISIFFSFIIWVVFIFPLTVFSAQNKVLVVMSYEESYPWVDEIRQGIEFLLAGTCRIKYFYMNTKVDLLNGPKKAKEAYELYEKWKPDGVIVADDNGQSMFAAPYLKDKVATPVIFCGVNADAKIYGYPASNVSGVLEREPIQASLVFLKQLVPSIKTFAFISKESPTTDQVEKQLQREKDLYPLKFVGTYKLKTMEDMIVVLRKLRKQCDSLLYITMEGLSDNNGRPLTDREILPRIYKNFAKPIITNAAYRVRYGALCAVVKSGQEHGRLSAEMLIKAMKGIPVSKIPITRNRFGRRIINIDVMKALSIQPKPEFIRSTELVTTEK